MTDSPRARVPMDPVEQPILESLLSIRTKLELLKADKSCCLKCDDVLSLYQTLLDQVHRLNDVRTDKRDEQNRVDTVLDDCFQLVSLAFMALGRNNEAPAIYSHVSTIKRLLDHLYEAAFFSEKDLIRMNQQIQEYREGIETHRAEADPHFLTLLEARLDICEASIRRLYDIISRLTPELKPYYEKLVSILRSLASANVRTKFPKAEVEDLTLQLKEMEVELKGMKIYNQGGQALKDRFNDKVSSAEYIRTASADDLVSDLLTRCLMFSDMIKQKPGYIGEGFRSLFERMIAMRNQLESRSLLQAWSLRETDLYDYQRRLDRIDESRTEDGNFLDEEGKPADLQTQRTLLYVLRKSYVLIYFILASSEPVSEALLPIYNQLKTLKKCLREVQKAGGVSSARELWPYSMKLTSIDNMRTDGAFIVSGHAPEGQSSVLALLGECFEILEQLKEQAMAASSDGQPERVVDQRIDMKA